MLPFLVRKSVPVMYLASFSAFSTMAGSVSSKVILSKAEAFRWASTLLFEEVVGEGTGVVEDVECLSFGDFVQDEEVFRDDFEVQGEEVFFRDDGEELDASVSSQM